MTARFARKTRKTYETQIEIRFNIDGAGTNRIDTGIPFFNHMLTQLSKHGGFDLDLKANGDLEIDTHHTVEDTGILLGEVFREALGNKAGVRRFASISVPLDEALIAVTVDLSGRPFFSYDIELPFGAPLGTPPFDAQLAEEFWRGFVMASGITLHIKMITGKNIHHIIEASFKAVARALRDAVRVEGTDVPSTKGTLSANEDHGSSVADVLVIGEKTVSGSVQAHSRLGQYASYTPDIPARQIKVVGLDFNGTLLADVDSYVSINVEFARRLGLKSLSGERFRQLAGTPDKDWTYAFRIIAAEESNECVLSLPRDSVSGLVTSATMEDLYQEIYEERMAERWARWEKEPESVLAFGAKQSIQKLLDKNIKVVIISTQSNKQIKSILELSGLLSEIGNESIYGRAVNKAETIRHVASTGGIKLGEMLYVGDERKDFVHAVESGTHFAHVSHGVNSREKIAAAAKLLARPVNLLDSFDQVPNVVSTINNNVPPQPVATPIEIKVEELKPNSVQLAG